jgi:DnaJ domain
MAKKGTIWNSPSKYGTYEGPRGNPSQWGATFEKVWENSPTVQTILGNTAYATLGLQPTANNAEIKTAYHLLARVHHPDKGGDPIKFQQITEAYNTLIAKQPPLFDGPQPTTPKRKKRPIVDDDEQVEESTEINPDWITPQLLTEIDEDEVESYLNNDDFCAQEKKDGKHITLQVKDNVLYVRNKKGAYSSCSPEFDALRHLKIDVIIDGEQVGDKFWAWDILELGTSDLRKQPYSARYKILKDVYTFIQELPGHPPIYILPVITGRDAKRMFFESLITAKKEGIVFKRLSAPFSVGKGLDQFKFKFYAEASVIVVAGRPGKRSIGMELFDANGQREFVGYCTCSLVPLPSVGSIAEVKYLYAYRGGCLYQTSFKELRDDVDLSECTTAQLKYKAEAE